MWQLHMMTDKDALDLAMFPGFRSDIIRKYLEENPDGDAVLSDYETQLRLLNVDNCSGSRLQNRYRVQERWG